MSMDIKQQHQLAVLSAMQSSVMPGTQQGPYLSPEDMQSVDCASFSKSKEKDSHTGAKVAAGVGLLATGAAAIAAHKAGEGEGIIAGVKKLWKGFGKGKPGSAADNQVDNAAGKTKLTNDVDASPYGAPPTTPVWESAKQNIGKTKSIINDLHTSGHMTTATRDALEVDLAGVTDAASARAFALKHQKTFAVPDAKAAALKTAESDIAKHKATIEHLETQLRGVSSPDPALSSRLKTAKADLEQAEKTQRRHEADIKRLYPEDGLLESLGVTKGSVKQGEVHARSLHGDNVNYVFTDDPALHCRYVADGPPLYNGASANGTKPDVHFYKGPSTNLFKGQADVNALNADQTLADTLRQHSAGINGLSVNASVSNSDNITHILTVRAEKDAAGLTGDVQAIDSLLNRAGIKIGTPPKVKVGEDLPAKAKVSGMVITDDPGKVGKVAKIYPAHEANGIRFPERVDMYADPLSSYHGSQASLLMDGRTAAETHLNRSLTSAPSATAMDTAKQSVGGLTKHEDVTAALLPDSQVYGQGQLHTALSGLRGTTAADKAEIQAFIGDVQTHYPGIDFATKYPSLAKADLTTPGALTAQERRDLVLLTQESALTGQSGNATLLGRIQHIAGQESDMASDELRQALQNPHVRNYLSSLPASTSAVDERGSLQALVDNLYGRTSTTAEELRRLPSS